MARSRALCRISILFVLPALPIPGAHADVLTFTPLCDTTWAGSCSGAPCLGGTLVLNNWQRSTCITAPPLPNTADDVVIGSVMTNNALPSVRSVLVTPGGSVTDQRGCGTSQGLTVQGAWLMAPQALAYAGNITIAPQGTLTDVGGSATRTFSQSTLENQGQMFVQGGATYTGAAGAALLNTGAITKSFAGSWSMTFPVTNTGTIALANDGGQVRLSDSSFTTTGSFSVGSNAEFQIQNTTLAGTVSATNAGVLQSTGTLTIAPAGATLAVLGNGFFINSMLTATGPLTNTRLATVAPFNRTYRGSITNAAGATWTENSTNATRTFIDCTFTNRGLVNLPGSLRFTSGGGTNTYINHGTLQKLGPAGVTTMDLPFTNAGQIDCAGDFSITGPFTNTGTIRMRSTSQLLGNPLTIGGGRIIGEGTIVPMTTLDAVTIAPNGLTSSTAVLYFQQGVTLSPATRFEVDMRAHYLNTQDVLSSNGPIALAGTLRVVVEPDFVPIRGRLYEIVHAGDGLLTGTFDTLEVQTFRPGIVLALDATPSTLRLRVVETPCDSLDFNRDALSPDAGDLDDFLAVLASGPSSCSTYPAPGCGDVDFNNDGFSPDSLDLDAFVSRLGGGPCL